MAGPAPLFTRARRRAAATRPRAGTLLLAMAFATLATPVAAAPRPIAEAADPAALCLTAADHAADRHGVPRAVMRALTRTETGRPLGGALQPWPWTVNSEGAGRWFDSRAEALDWALAEQARGARSFDIGCFQVNHRWHGAHFASVSAMFDPFANADYAARFLRELHAETGGWEAAAGFYHSRTPEFASRYRDRFARILARGDGGDRAVGPVRVAAAPPAPDPDPQDRPRRRPLLMQTAALLPQTPGAVPMRFVAGAGPLARAARPLID